VIFAAVRSGEWQRWHNCEPLASFVARRINRAKSGPLLFLCRRLLMQSSGGGGGATQAQD
jgi:hypothetical protein